MTIEEKIKKYEIRQRARKARGIKTKTEASDKRVIYYAKGYWPNNK